MKINQPVTQRDIALGDDVEIISTTDMRGILTSYNEDFLILAGYSDQEMENKNHNIIRHPDMPPEAFHMLWDAIKNTNPWMGIVKNRSKNGDHYWVDAYASPQYEDGQITGYQSVRVKPQKEWVDRAEKLYGKIMAAKSDEDKRRSTLAEVKLSRFPISFTARVSLAVIAVLFIVFGALTGMGQVSLVWGTAGFVVGSILSYATIYILFSDLRKLADRCSRITSDPVAQHVYTGRMDEIGQIDLGITFVNAKLRTAIGRVKESSAVLERSAAEIASGNLDLSQRTEEQAASLEETASSMEQMTSAVRQNADNAQQSNQIATEARKQAENGGEVVGQAVTAMGGISASSKRIEEIINVINDIAFQINLLSLNAAVEAANAGEHGRGFAVVAGEVRKLSGRTADAAKEIKGLIQESVEQVDQGTVLVDKSGASLQEIVTHVKKVSDIVADIAASSGQQASGVEEVNKAITQMDEITQQNAALVEQAAAASHAMEDKVRLLSGLALQFRQETA